MDLKDYISEAISSGRHKIAHLFPRENPDKDSIIKWLEYNGFKPIDNNFKLLGSVGCMVDDVDYFIEKNGSNRIYNVGRFRSGQPGTHWIQFANKYALFTIIIAEDERMKKVQWYSRFKIEFRDNMKDIRVDDINIFADFVEKEFC